MSSCSAFGCSSSEEKGFQLYQFPCNTEHKLMWESIVKKRAPEQTEFVKSWCVDINSALCTRHFSLDSFEKVQADGKRRLRVDAIPSIFFDYNKQNEDRMEIKCIADHNYLLGTGSEVGVETIKLNSPAQVQVQGEKIGLKVVLPKDKRRLATVEQAEDSVVNSSLEDKGEGEDIPVPDKEEISANKKVDGTHKIRVDGFPTIIPTTLPSVSNERSRKKAVRFPTDHDYLPQPKAAPVRSSTRKRTAKSRVAKSLAAKSATKSPVANSSAAKSSAANRSAARSSVSKSSAAEIPAAESPVAKLPTADALLAQIQAVQSSTKPLDPETLKVPDHDLETKQKKRELGQLRRRVTELEDRVKSLTKQNLSLQKLVYKRKLESAKSNTSLSNLNKKLERLFTRNQLVVLTRGAQTNGLKWDNETTKKCLHLRLICGSKGYDLLKDSGYPLPSHRTLQRFIKDYICEKGGLPKTLINQPKPQAAVQNGTSQEDAVSSSITTIQHGPALIRVGPADVKPIGATIRETTCDNRVVASKIGNPKSADQLKNIEQVSFSDISVGQKDDSEISGPMVKLLVPMDIDTGYAEVQVVTTDDEPAFSRIKVEPKQRGYTLSTSERPVSANTKERQVTAKKTVVEAGPHFQTIKALESKANQLSRMIIDLKSKKKAQPTESDLAASKIVD